MDYRDAFRAALDKVRGEGRYRVFADLKRHRGAFPRATWTKPDGTTREVEAAGFKFVGESRVLRNAADDHTKSVFDPAIRGDTDQFALKFRR